MAFIHGKLTGVLWNQWNLSAYLNEVSAPTEIEATETTVFGVGSKQYIAGLADGTLSLSGLFDGADDASAELLESALAADTNGVLTVGYGGLVDLNTCAMLEGIATSYEPSTAVADVAEISSEFQATGGVDYGTILEGLQSVATATTTNGSSLDNGAATANGGVAHLHVTANATSGNTTVTVQHSTNNSTWADLASFTVVSTGVETAQRVAVAAGTTVNRYVRAACVTSGTGAVVYTVAFARR